MVRGEDFQVVGIQVVIFTPEEQLSSAKFIASVLRNQSTRYSGEVQAIPLPERVPPEIPRVILQSPDQDFRLEAALSRINSLWNSRTDSKVVVAERAAECWEPVRQFVEENSIAVGRIALIVSRMLRDPNPAQTLIDRFCSPQARKEPLNRSETFEIHNHKQYAPPCTLNSLSALRVNSWVRCKTASILEDDALAILVEQDFNTLAEELESRRFQPDEITAFVNLAARETDIVFQKYFPDELPR